MRRSSVFLAVVIILGCGGSGGGGVALPAKLEGTINTADFSIPAGQSRTVTGDLTINATSSIKIAGTLIIPAGVNVNLWSEGDIELSGNLQAGAPTPGGRGFGPYNTTVVGGNIRSSGNHSVGTGGNLVFASSAGNVPATVSISGNITLPAGMNARNRNEDGQDGGAVLIGGTLAVSIVTDSGRPCQSPKSITLNASLTAGNGGGGYDDVQGLSFGQDVSGLGSHGGGGGDVVVHASESLTIGAGVSATPGTGGRGGWVGRVPGDSSYLTATDGTGVASPGGKADVFVGRGGSAGTITIIAPTTTGSATKTVVAGGNPGNGYVQSGKGGPGGPGAM